MYGIADEDNSPRFTQYKGSGKLEGKAAILTGKSCDHLVAVIISPLTYPHPLIVGQVPTAVSVELPLWPSTEKVRL